MTLIHVECEKVISVKQKSIKTYKKKTNLKISLNNLEKIE